MDKVYNEAAKKAGWGPSKKERTQEAKKNMANKMVKLPVRDDNAKKLHVRDNNPKRLNVKDEN